MDVLTDLLRRVDARFESAGAALAQWPDPHRGAPPADDKYSRVTNPARWRIIGARAEAWLSALVDLGAAEIERNAVIIWQPPPPVTVTSCDRVEPRAAGALPLVVGRTTIADVDDAGVILGLADPTPTVGWFPDCGCDACDSGSQDAIDELDTYLCSIVSGEFRRLTSRGRSITVLSDRHWSASGVPSRDVRAIIARPLGWSQLRGQRWMPRK